MNVKQNLPMEFQYSTQTQTVHIELLNDAPFFLAKDVCDALGLDNVTKALYSLDEDEKLTLPVVRSGQTREMNFVNESGLYNLIFQSRKPAAKKFRKWVTAEVLPAIRKSGGYGKAQQAVPNLLNAHSILDLVNYCQQVQHNGQTWYAATQLKTFFGKNRSGDTTPVYLKLEAEGLAIKFPPGHVGAKWYVCKKGIARLLGIKPKNLLNISLIKTLNEGGVQ